MTLNLYFALQWKDPFVSPVKGEIVGLQKEEHDKLWRPIISVLNMESMKPKVGLNDMNYFYTSKDHSVRNFFG